MSHQVWQYIFSSPGMTFASTHVHVHLPWQISLTKHMKIITEPFSSSTTLSRDPNRRHLQSCFWCCRLDQLPAGRGCVRGVTDFSLAVSMEGLSPFLTATVNIKCSADSYSTDVHCFFISHQSSRYVRTLAARHRAGVQVLELDGKELAGMGLLLGKNFHGSGNEVDFQSSFCYFMFLVPLSLVSPPREAQEIMAVCPFSCRLRRAVRSCLASLHLPLCDLLWLWWELVLLVVQRTPNSFFPHSPKGKGEDYGLFVWNL